MSRNSYIKQEWGGDYPAGRVEPTQTRLDDGYGAEIPPAEEFNYLFNQSTAMLKNAEENGIMQWNANTNYDIGSLAMGLDGTLYKSKISNNTGNALVNNQNWGVVSTEWIVFNASSNQTYQVFSDGGRTFSYSAGLKQWIIPVGSTSDQINELIDSMPRISTSSYITYKFSDGIHILTSSIIIKPCNYEVRIEGNSSDTTQSITKSVTLQAVGNTSIITSENNSVFKLSYLKISAVSVTVLISTILSNKSSITIDACYIEGTENNGILVSSSGGFITTLNTILAYGSRQFFITNSLGNLQTTTTRDYPATTYQALAFGLYADGGAHIGSAATTTLLGAVGDENTFNATIV